MPVPRFDQFSSSSDVASRTKSKVRSKNTRAERALRSSLHNLGLRYRLHADDLPGRPDIVFRSARLAIFVDGDYWHGRSWKARREKLAHGSNAAYWVAKIQTNRTRDRRHNRILREVGWEVVRFWETDVLKDPLRAARLVRARLRMRLNDVSNIPS
jgi:DNA mismatch endonuclease, patch repair protein